jgi:murein DD-endopeptidase MepM/ murein hydrolase activator NlpD
MTRSRTLVALVAVALLALVTPAAASSSDPRSQREAARTRKARLASELNTLNASERQLLAAARTLQRQVDAETSAVSAARRAAAAADVAVFQSQTALNRTKNEVSHLSHLVVERAVAAYMSPHRRDPSQIGETRDLAVAGRRTALLDSVAQGDTDVIDQLHAAEEDYEIQLAAARDAQARARARKAETEARLASLTKARAAQARIAAGVLARKRAVLGEIAAQSRAEAELTRIINQRGSAVDSGVRNPGGCIWPARGHVTSEFGRRWGRMHEGIDIANSTGTPIYAAKTGTVIFAGQQSGYGNVVIIDHGGGFTTVYAHQSRFATHDGAHLNQGQLLGYMGSTGHSTGPHVHFETRYGGSPRNPRGCLP